MNIFLVNFPVVSGGFALLAAAGQAQAVGVAATGISSTIFSSSYLGGAAGLLGKARKNFFRVFFSELSCDRNSSWTQAWQYVSMCFWNIIIMHLGLGAAAQMCVGPFMCRTPTGECCQLFYNEGSVVCPVTCKDNINRQSDGSDAQVQDGYSLENIFSTTFVAAAMFNFFNSISDSASTSVATTTTASTTTTTTTMTTTTSAPIITTSKYQSAVCFLQI